MFSGGLPCHEWKCLDWTQTPWSNLVDCAEQNGPELYCPIRQLPPHVANQIQMGTNEKSVLKSSLFQSYWLHVRCPTATWGCVVGQHRYRTVSSWQKVLLDILDWMTWGDVTWGRGVQVLCGVNQSPGLQKDIVAPSDQTGGQRVFQPSLCLPCLSERIP